MLTSKKSKKKTPLVYIVCTQPNFLIIYMLQDDTSGDYKKCLTALVVG